MRTAPHCLVSRLIKSNDGLEIYAEAAGDPSKPHVVFIHGLSLSGIVWDAQFASSNLLKRIYAVRYDLRGHGRTGKPLELQAWTSERFAEDFDAVVKAFNLKSPVLAGWSYGSTPAVDVVNSFGPSYLSGIIYIGAIGYTDAYHIVTPWQTASLARIQAPSDPATHLQALRDSVEGCFVNPGAIPIEIREAWVQAKLVQPPAVRRRVLRREQDKERFWNEGGPVIPLLVVHGQKDRICHHDNLIEESRERFANVQIESWPGVGHAPFMENLDLFNNTVVRWVENITDQALSGKSRL